MHKILLLPLLVACGGTTPPPPVNAPTPPPAVFDEPGSIGEVVKSRGYERGDVVQKLFAEALERDTALANLLAAIDEAQVQFTDSAQAFLEFRTNNSAFHTSAEAHVQALADSSDRKAWNEKLRMNKDQVAQRTAPTEALLGARTAMNAELDRLRTLLMLEHALTAMRSYQLNGMPSNDGMAEGLTRLKVLRDRLRQALAQAEGA